MRTGGQSPSRIAITTLEGEEYPQVITLATGMTHRFYSRAFVNTVNGEQSMGAAEQRDFLNDVAFDVLEESSPGQVVRVEPNGCLWGLGPGQAMVRLSAFSLKKGQLEAFIKMNVSTVTSATAQDLGAVTDFSVAQLKTTAGTFYGLTRNHKFAVISGAGQVAGGIQDASLDAQSTDHQHPYVWRDTQNSGFFVSYSAPRPSTTRRLSTSFFPFGAQATTPVTTPALSFDNLEKNSPLDIQKVYAGALSNQMPVILAVTKDWNTALNSNQGGFDNTTMALFAMVHPGLQALQTSQSSSAYLSDSNGIIRMAVSDTEVDQAIQFSQGQSGNFYIAVGTYVDTSKSSSDRTQWLNKSELKLIIFDGSQSVVETPLSTLSLGEVANKKDFALEASFDVPQIVFIRKSDNNLIFIQRTTTWKSAQLDTGVDTTFSPKFIANNEDGTLIIAWKKNNKIYFQISKDFGTTWLQTPLELNSNVSEVELVPLPCGGSGLVTLEGSDLNLRFVNDLFKTFSFAVKLGSGLKKIQIFRERETVKLFFLDGGGKLTMTTFP